MLIKLELVRIILRVVYCHRMTVSQKSSIMLGFSEEEKPGDKVQEHPETLTLS